MSAIETFEHAGFTVEIHPHDDAGNPRTEYDNLGTLWLDPFGDVGGDAGAGSEYPFDPNDFETFDGLVKAMNKHTPGVVVVPVVVFSHSSDTTIRVARERFTNHISGVIYVTRERVLSEMARAVKPNVYDDSGYCIRPAKLAKPKILSKSLRERAVSSLEGEIRELNRYLTGEVYGYIVKDERGEEVESLWGFYELEEVIQEAKSAAEYERTWREKQRAERLQAHSYIQTMTAAFWLPAFA